VKQRDPRIVARVVLTALAWAAVIAALVQFTAH